jgi:hypothetical protein
MWWSVEKRNGKEATQKSTGTNQASSFKETQNRKCEERKEE